MRKLIVRGPVLTQSGYGYHARQFVHWARDLQSAGHFDQVIFQILPWGITPWILNTTDPYDKDIIDYIMTNSGAPETQADASIQVQLPHEWEPKLAKFNIGVTAGVETDRVPTDWIKPCLDMDRIIVPSTFSKQAFLNAATDDYERRRLEKRIQVINEAYHPSLLASNNDNIDTSILPENCLLIFGQITGTDASNDRKNTFNAIRWFVEQHGDDPNCALIIKTNSGKNTMIDRKITRGKIDACIREAAAISGRGTKARVFLLHGAITESEKRSIYTCTKIKALFMPTRGEGYGLPVLEACLFGLPVIAPAASGYMDFASDLITPISAPLVQVPASRIDGKIFVNGSRWYEPDPISCKKAMAEALASNIFERNLNNKILQSLSIDNIIKILNSKYLRQGELLK